MPHKEEEEEFTEFTPTQYPSFPSDLKTIHLETISLQKIQNNDQQEHDRMFKACKTWGFFYLNLSHSDQGQIINQGADSIARVAEKIMRLPLEEKLRYSLNPKQREIFG